MCQGKVDNKWKTSLNINFKSIVDKYRHFNTFPSLFHSATKRDTSGAEKKRQMDPVDVGCFVVQYTVCFIYKGCSCSHIMEFKGV